MIRRLYMWLRVKYFLSPSRLKSTRNIKPPAQHVSISGLSALNTFVFIQHSAHVCCRFSRIWSTNLPIITGAFDKRRIGSNAIFGSLSSSWSVYLITRIATLFQETQIHIRTVKKNSKKNSPNRHQNINWEWFAAWKIKDIKIGEWQSFVYTVWHCMQPLVGIGMLFLFNYAENCNCNLFTAWYLIRAQYKSTNGWKPTYPQKLNYILQSERTILMAGLQSHFASVCVHTNPVDFK